MNILRRGGAIVPVFLFRRVVNGRGRRKIYLFWLEISDWFGLKFCLSIDSLLFVRILGAERLREHFRILLVDLFYHELVALEDKGFDLDRSFSRLSLFEDDITNVGALFL